MHTETIDSEQLSKWLPDVCQIAFQAGRLISELYHQPTRLDVEQKSDGTPVTLADQQADALICRALQRLSPELPLITEESVAQVPFETRQAWSNYWLVDPLDGTKEFIGGTGEYSVNIALVVNHQPVLGVVYGPELGDLYFSIKGQAAFKLDGLTALPESTSWPELLHQAKPIKVHLLRPGEKIQVAVSRRHGGVLQTFLSQLGDVNLIRMGSALKTCLVAEGKADVYPRFGATSLWDTAASQCILESAGGAVLNAAGHPLHYVQTPSLLNPFFMAVSDQDYPWPHFPEVM